MKLLINHQTSYRYALPCAASWQNVHLTPCNTPAQHILAWQVGANAPLHSYTDGFRNVSHLLTLNEPVSHLVIMAQGFVEVNGLVDGEEDHSLPPELFLLSTSMTEMGEHLTEFASRFSDLTTHAHLVELAEAILERMPYSPASTDFQTTAEQAFLLKKGVCQDHTHVFVTLARHAGVPARYISGYLYTDDASHLSTHAWAEACLGGRWYTFDISNQIFSPEAHVKLAVGRDFYDASPVRGVRQGGVEEQLEVVVRVLKSD